MSIQRIVIRQYSIDQPQPLLEQTQSSKTRFAEFAGGTTAECAVVCCCIPLSLVNLFVLAVYGVPLGLLKKALKKKRRRRLLKKGLLIEGGGGGGDADVDGDFSSSSCDGAELLIRIGAPVSVDREAVDLENEMWDRFYGTGFWRSVSQRVD